MVCWRRCAWLVNFFFLLCLSFWDLINQLPKIQATSPKITGHPEDQKMMSGPGPRDQKLVWEYFGSCSSNFPKKIGSRKYNFSNSQLIFFPPPGGSQRANSPPQNGSRSPKQLPWESDMSPTLWLPRSHDHPPATLSFWPSYDYSSFSISILLLFTPVPLFSPLELKIYGWFNTSVTLHGWRYAVFVLSRRYDQKPPLSPYYLMLMVYCPKSHHLRKDHLTWNSKILVHIGAPWLRLW